MSPSRKPDPVPELGRISDDRQVMKLIHGHGWEEICPELGERPTVTPQDWERARKQVERDAPSSIKSPHTFEEEVGSYASVDVWRRQQHKRIDYLLEAGMLEGKALKTALWMRTQHEGRERHWESE